MKRASGSFVRLDIVGIDPRFFEICKQNNQTVVQSRGRDRRLVSSEESSASNMEPIDPALASIPKDQLPLYVKIVSITIDFERAYGRGVEIRIFERSPNKFLNSFLRRKESSEILNPTFYVNGVKVYTGIPNSFSQLDEAIDKSIGSKDQAIK